MRRSRRFAGIRPSIAYDAFENIEVSGRQALGAATEFAASSRWASCGAASERLLFYSLAPTRKMDRGGVLRRDDLVVADERRLTRWAAGKMGEMSLMQKMLTPGEIPASPAVVVVEAVFRSPRSDLSSHRLCGDRRGPTSGGGRLPPRRRSNLTDGMPRTGGTATVRADAVTVGDMPVVLDGLGTVTSLATIHG